MSLIVATASNVLQTLQAHRCAELDQKLQALRQETARVDGWRHGLLQTFYHCVCLIVDVEPLARLETVFTYHSRSTVHAHPRHRYSHP